MRCRGKCLFARDARDAARRRPSNSSARYRVGVIFKVAHTSDVDACRCRWRSAESAEGSLGLRVADRIAAYRLLDGKSRLCDERAHETDADAATSFGWLGPYFHFAMPLQMELLISARSALRRRRLGGTNEAREKATAVGASFIASAAGGAASSSTRAVVIISPRIN